MRVYKMYCPEGDYAAASWLSLGWQIFKHRFGHLVRGEGWRD
jgi:hypothetical protein